MRLLILVIALVFIAGCVERKETYLQHGKLMDEKPTTPLPNSKGSNPICSIDFANFTYVWPDSKPERKFTLVQGGYKATESYTEGPPAAHLMGVYFGDATNDGLKDAIVVMSITSGGSAIPHIIYVYEHQSSSNEPKLLFGFETGDRALGGLKSVYTDAGQLVVEIFEEFPNKGDCCPSKFKRTAYRWHEEKFVRTKEEILPNPTGSAKIELPTSQCP